MKKIDGIIISKIKDRGFWLKVEENDNIFIGVDIKRQYDGTI